MGQWADAMRGGSQSVNNVGNWEPDDKNRNIESVNNTDQQVNYQAPEMQQAPDIEPARAWDVHFTPQYFIDELQNRKNPEYQSELTGRMEDSTVEAIGKYASGMKEQHPDEWRYGDPGWDTQNGLWQDYIKPVEAQYQEEQRQAKIKQQQTQQNTELAILNRGNNQAPIVGQEVAENLVKNDPRFKALDIDTSDADYNNLDRSGKIINSATPATAGTDVKNAPKTNRYTQPFLGALMSSTGPATIAKAVTAAVGGPVGWIYGLTQAATFGYSYAKGTGHIQGNKYIDKIIEYTDILDTKGAQFQGALAYGFEKIGGGDITSWRDAPKNLSLIVNNFGDFLHYAFGSGKASSEYNAEVVGIVGSMVPNMGANVIGGGHTISRGVRNAFELLDNPEDRQILDWSGGQVTRNNLGLSGVYELDDMLTGSNAYLYWLEFGQALYDAGMTNPTELESTLGEYITKTYGDLSNFSEYFEHELGDPGNTMEGMQSRSMNVYANITHDTNLANASKGVTGNIGMDLAGQVPGLQGLIETVGRAFGKEIRSSGGIDEVIGAWNIENLKSDPSQLTARDRRISGITADNKIAGLAPLTDPHAVKNPFARGAQKIINFFSTTNEWRAEETSNAIFESISLGMEDAIQARPNDTPAQQVERLKAFVDSLEHPENIPVGTPFHQFAQSALFNTVKDDLATAVRSQRSEIDKVIEQYKDSNNNRAALNKLAESLNMTPAKIMDMYQNQKTVLTQLILNKADENGGTIPGINIPVDRSEFGNSVIAMLSPFSGDNALAYDPRLLMTQITTKVADGVTDTLVNKYNIQTEGWIYRFGDMVKKMQNLWLLGLSPSYLANNLVNNVLTRSAIGYGGFLTPKAINSFMDRFGFTPERFAESGVSTLTEQQITGNRTNSEKLREAIRNRKKGTRSKVEDSVNNFSTWVSNNLGIFGKISGWVEEWESKQVMTSAMMTYHARTWKAGVNYRKMPVQLENLIRSQNPGMVDAIYSAISAGMNMDEIENAIFGTFVAPSVQDTLLDSAKNLGLNNPEDIITEYFVKGGMLAQLNEALKGRDSSEVDKIVEEFGKKLEKLLKIQLDNDLATRAESVANMVGNEGWVKATELAQDISDKMAKVWAESQDANSQIFDRRIAENMSASEFHALYQDHLRNLNERWKAVYQIAQQTYSGVLKGMGLGDSNRKAYADALLAKNELWMDFYDKKQPELIQPYLDSLVWRADDDFGKWNSRVKKAYADYQKSIRAAYQTALNDEVKLQQKMDNAFANAMKQALGETKRAEVDNVLIPKMNEIKAQRQRIVVLNQQIRAEANKSKTLDATNLVWKENIERLQEERNKYYQLQKELYEAIRLLNPFATNQTTDTVTDEVDHAVNIRADIAERQADEAQQKASQSSDEAVDKIVETEDVPDITEEVQEWQVQTVEAPLDPVMQARTQENLTEGKFVPLQNVDLTSIPEGESRDSAMDKLVQTIMDAERTDPEFKGEYHTAEQIEYYILNSVDEKGNPMLSEEDRANIILEIQLADDANHSIDKEIQMIRQGMPYAEEVPDTGTYVLQTYAFDFGYYTIVGAVFQNGEVVAYVPSVVPNVMRETELAYAGEPIKVLGVSPDDPDVVVYMFGNKVYEEQQRVDTSSNMASPEMEQNTMPMTDPSAEAHNQMAYEDILPILNEFKRLFKQKLDDAFTNNRYNSLNDNTRELLRGYIEDTVRTDMMNAKYKTGKFGEMMRDAALLNYSKRYGFDNLMTLLFPYQFWQTRSLVNWMSRMGGKGGKMWRRYARLKDLEDRNKKEIMPSRISGKIGFYIPWLPDWMGDQLFIPTSQLSIVGNFMEPVYDYFSDKNALLATAERYVQEAFQNDEISFQEYQKAMNEATREQSSAWQEAFAKAKLTESSEADFGSLFKQYFGMALPVTIGKALLTGDTDEWNQTPMTRTGTAWRAIFGDNWLGKGGEFLLSAPERALRATAVKLTGNNDFAYNEFGNWGDYYIRNQVWDMVVEGRISPQDAIEAVTTKDGNRIWEEAADRQRQEILQKTQVLSAIPSVKNFIKDLKDGNVNQQTMRDDWLYMLAGVMTSLTPGTAVREAERTWREQSAELSGLFEANDKEGRKKFYEDNPNYTYKNIRYENDPEQALRQYLYKSIMDVYYDLDKEEKLEISATFGKDFSRDVLDNDTRAIESMDINRLWAYAEAINGKTPYLATDKLREVGVTNPPQINMYQIPQTEKDAHREYIKERERLHPGMADISNMYYKLPPEDRKVFRQYNPGLDQYWQWNTQYKQTHPEVANYNKRQQKYYDMLEAEEACSLFDEFTMKELTRSAYTGKAPDSIFQYNIERVMRQVGSTDNYKDFTKKITDYILGQ